MKTLKLWPLMALLAMSYGIWFFWKKNPDLRNIAKIMMTSVTHVNFAGDQQYAESFKRAEVRTQKPNTDNTRTVAKAFKKSKGNGRIVRGIASVSAKQLKTKKLSTRKTKSSTQEDFIVDSKKRVIIEDR